MGFEGYGLESQDHQTVTYPRSILSREEIEVNHLIWDRYRLISYLHCLVQTSTRQPSSTPSVTITIDTFLPIERHDRLVAMSRRHPPCTPSPHPPVIPENRTVIETQKVRVGRRSGFEPRGRKGDGEDGSGVTDGYDRDLVGGLSKVLRIIFRYCRQSVCASI